MLAELLLGSEPHLRVSLVFTNIFRWLCVNQLNH
jgi:hypothetical protein